MSPVSGACLYLGPISQEVVRAEVFMPASRRPLAHLVNLALFDELPELRVSHALHEVPPPRRLRHRPLLVPLRWVWHRRLAHVPLPPLLPGRCRLPSKTRHMPHATLPQYLRTQQTGISPAFMYIRDTRHADWGDMDSLACRVKNMGKDTGQPGSFLT